MSNVYLFFILISNASAEFLGIVCLILYFAKQELFLSHI